MKTAIITGASRGVGKAAAKIFAQSGYRLIINCRSNFDLLETTAAELRASAKQEILTVHGPITEDVLQNHLGISLDTSGTPEDELILINNGSISTFNLVQDVSDEEYSRMIESNISTMFRTTRAIIPYMLKTRKGRIINISSVWGVVGASMESVYSLTKGAVNSFTMALGKELAPNHIPVNAVALGCVDTDMNGWMTEDDRAEIEEEIPYGRMATPAEVADFLLLLSKAPAYLTAQVIPFNGGWS